MKISTAFTIGAVIAIIFTVFICIAVLPAKKKVTLSGFLLTLHNLFNFTSLLVEKLLKVLYVFVTGFCIAGGFFLLFSKVGYGNSTFGWGLLLLILGPILARIIFESAMVFILILRSTNDINKKIDVIVDDKTVGCDDGDAIRYPIDI